MAKRERDRTPRPSNRAEAEWLAIAARLHPACTVTPHGMTLVFADGDRYTVDLLAAAELPYRGTAEMCVIAYEVKAGYRGPGWEQGMERFKRAKAQFPWLELRLAEKRDGLWYVDGERLEA